MWHIGKFSNSTIHKKRINLHVIVLFQDEFRLAKMFSFHYMLVVFMATYRQIPLIEYIIYKLGTKRRAKEAFLHTHTEQARVVHKLEQEISCC
jgi:hypothetical protein